MRNAIEQPKGMLAGQVAKDLGIGVQTLHFYEREGLIPAPRRAENGYRVYDTALVDRVRFVRKAQALGLTLEDTKEVVQLAGRGSCPCGHVHAALAERLKEVDERLKELRSFRSDLASLVKRAARVSADAQRTGRAHNSAKLCAIVEEAPPVVQLGRAPARPPLKRQTGRISRSAGSS